jgi:hypothetical protein
MGSFILLVEPEVNLPVPAVEVFCYLVQHLFGLACCPPTKTAWFHCAVDQDPYIFLLYCICQLNPAHFILVTGFLLPMCITLHLPVSNWIPPLGRTWLEVIWVHMRVRLPALDNSQSSQLPNSRCYMNAAWPAG